MIGFRIKNFLVRQGFLLFISKEVDFFDLVFQSFQIEVSGRPVENAEIKFPLFLGDVSPFELDFVRACLGSVNCVAVDFHPVAYFGQDIDRFLWDKAFGSRADVQEVVSAFGCYVKKQTRQRLRRFPFVVLLLETPGIVEGRRHFPVAGNDSGRYHIISC